MIFTILLVGDAKVGKTTYIDRVLMGIFDEGYVPTSSPYELRFVEFTTATGQIIVFKIVEMPGQNESSFYSIPLGHIDGALIMFDTTYEVSYQSVPHWETKIKNKYGNVPTVILGNKIDLPHRNFSFHRDVEYFETFQIPSSYIHNREKPFLTLARTLLNDENLTFQ